MIHQRKPSFVTDKHTALIVIIAWFVGFVSGCFLYQIIRDTHLSWMRSAAFGSVSIVGSLICALLPFVFTAFAVVYSDLYLLFAVVCIKGCVYTTAVMGCYSYYGNSGWLAQILLMLIDSVGAALFLFVVMRSKMGDLRCYTRHTLFSGLVLLSVSVLHFWLFNLV